MTEAEIMSKNAQVTEVLKVIDRYLDMRTMTWREFKGERSTIMIAKGCDDSLRIYCVYDHERSVVVGFTDRHQKWIKTGFLNWLEEISVSGPKGAADAIKHLVQKIKGEVQRVQPADRHITVEPTSSKTVDVIVDGNISISAWVNAEDASDERNSTAPRARIYAIRVHSSMVVYTFTESVMWLEAMKAALGKRLSEEQQWNEHITGAIKTRFEMVNTLHDNLRLEVFETLETARDAITGCPGTWLVYSFNDPRNDCRQVFTVVLRTERVIKAMNTVPGIKLWNTITVTGPRQWNTTQAPIRYRRKKKRSRPLETIIPD